MLLSCRLSATLLLPLRIVCTVCLHRLWEALTVSKQTCRLLDDPRRHPENFSSRKSDTDQVLLGVHRQVSLLYAPHLQKVASHTN